MKTCTWVGCDRPAAHPQVGKDGQEWANLCHTHNGELQDRLKDPKAPTVLAVWIKAQGGPKAAAKRMTR